MQLFGMEKLSLVDYDGYVAATVFTGSCNFRCGFCHNSPLVLAYDSLGTLPEEEVFEYLKTDWETCWDTNYSNHMI